MFFHSLQPMQYKLKILPSILFSFSGCSWQQTHSLCVGMIWHHSQDHQNVPSNQLFTSSILLSPSSGLGTRSGSKWLRLKISHGLQYTNTLAKTKSLEQDDVPLSGLARPGRRAFVSKWWLPMPNFKLLWRQISWDRMHFRN